MLHEQSVTVHFTACRFKLLAEMLYGDLPTAGLADRDAGVAVVKASLTQLADYMQSTSGGDAVKIESAGMSVRADRTPVTMTQVLNLAVSEGDNPASLDAMWKPVAGVRSYECQVNSSDPNVEANWSFKQSTSKSSVTLTGLTSGTKVWVRIDRKSVV